VSRIVGVMAQKPDERIYADLLAMKSQFAAGGRCEEIKRGSGMAMGAVSLERGCASIAERGPLLACVDGCFFDVDGVSLSAGSSAGTLLDLYERFGFVGALKKVNGDFAIALYDSSLRRLWLGRDRVGVRPLYYAQGPDFFYWASQPGALLRCSGFNREISRRYVGLFAGSHYRTFDNDPSSSPFENIYQLPAAHIAEVSLGTPPRIAPYWSLTEDDDFSASEDTLAEQYRELLLDSVRIRLRHASEFGFLLSGGMDSSSVLAAAVHLTGNKQKALSTVYSDPTYDESQDIRSMLEENVEEWSPIRVDSPDLFTTVERMIRAHDEPVATATWLAHFILCERASQSGINALFGGLGGDELNAGEYEHFFYHFADIRRAGDEPRLEREVNYWAMYHDHPLYRKSLSAVNQCLPNLVNLNQPGVCIPDRKRIDRYADAVNKDYFDVAAFIPRMDAPFNSYLKNRTYQDIFFETAPCCLRAEDRQANAFGLTHFAPFFDYRLLEFMFKIPGHLKIRDGVTKVLLRQATKGLLPEETRARIKKTGWNAPAHLWFSGKSLDLLRDLVRSREFRERGIYNVKEVDRIVDEHQRIVESGTVEENHMMFLWQLLNLEAWQVALRRVVINKS
jgi:asparagine synthase (glutamine-hydrolysing)